MARKVGYEWAINECKYSRINYGIDAGDIEYDIIDSDYSDTLAGFSDADIVKIDDNKFRLELVRRVYDDCETMKDIQYVGVELDGSDLVMAERFDGGAKIPERLHAELVKLNKRRKALLAKAAR